MRYQTTAELLDGDNDETDPGKKHEPWSHHYVEGERLSGNSYIVEGEDENGEVNDDHASDIATADANDPQDYLDRRLPATPQKNLFDEEGDPRWTVPFKFREFGLLEEVRSRATRGCSLCQLVIHASQLLETSKAKRHAGSKAQPSHTSDKSQCKTRFDFKDIENGVGVEEINDIPKARATRKEPTKPSRSQSSITAQENGYYECTLSIGPEFSVSVCPLLARDTSDFAWFGGRLIQPEIDYSLVEQWLSSCDTLHPACNEENNKIDFSLVERLRVIDVIDGCLTEISVPGSKFVALSYVWGDAPTLKVTTESLKQLEEPGALDIRGEQVPNTTRDAIHVVRKLGLRYLWTDSLCILQDDIQEMAPQLRRMDLIYAAAYFTIVAADGANVAAGLPGSNPQRERQVPLPFNYSEEMQLLLILTTLPEVLLKCPWSTRLWTLQEALMSRRLLLFTATGLHFTCSSLSWSENLKATSETQPPPWKHVNENMFHFRGSLAAKDSTPTPTIDSMWDMEEWMTMIMESSERKLGFEWDVENATAGLVSQLETFYQTRNLYGMPECMLLECLYWSPMPPGSLRRRKDAAGSPLHPTWSWGGWVGEVSWPGGVVQDVQSREDTQFSICKLSTLDAEPTPLAKGGPDSSRALQEAFPYLHVSARMMALSVNKRLDAPESIQELQPFAWFSVLPEGVSKVGVYLASTRQDPPMSAGSIVFDSMTSCPDEDPFECHFLQIYPKPQTLGVGRHAGQSFYNVLAIRPIKVLDDGTVFAERIGHGRILLSETEGMWIRKTVILR